MPAANQRIQVTVDGELAAALEAIDPNPSSRSRLVRDLALRGARAMHDERRRRAEAIETLVAIARGDDAYDLAIVERSHAERGDGLG